jgi:hypothetical protein
MTSVGSPTAWANLIDTLVPEILALIIATWEEMPAPAGNAHEDPVTTAFCIRLRAARNRCDLPFDIWTQLVELESPDGEEQGRMDIVFKPMVPRENIYFCLECKRLNVRTATGVRPYCAEYVRLGMIRFVNGRYSTSVRHGGMLAYVLDADVASAMSNVQTNIRTRLHDLGMEAPGTFVASNIFPNDSRVRESHHRRPAAPDDVFVIHHVFMAGDPNAPLQIVRSEAVTTVAKRKRKPRTPKL